MLFSWQEKQECCFCGEKFDSRSNRCPYCAGIQGREKKQPKKQSVEGNGFVLLGDSSDVKEKKREKSERINNGHKVFLSVICAALPGIGQLTGVIAGLFYLDSEQEDRKSFGKALLIASIIMFVLSSIFIYFLALAFMTVSI